jgi:hypothetical protein
MRNYKIDDNQQKNLLAKFAEYLKTYTPGSTKIAFSDTIHETKATEKILVTFSAVAYIKMRELVDRSSFEIGWYGLIDKLSPTEYRIEDIIVYPQTVTSVTVKEDDEVWDADMSIEDIRRRHFHGHSHVNMPVCPSTTDMEHRKELTDMLNPDSFFLFLITNKRCDISAELYDLSANTIYNTDDIAFDVDLGTGSLAGFIESYEKLVKQHKFFPESSVSLKEKIVSNTTATKTSNKTNSQKFTKKKSSKKSSKIDYPFEDSYEDEDFVSDDPQSVNDYLTKYMYY